MNLGKPWSVRLTEGLGGALQYMQADDPVCTKLFFALAVAPESVPPSARRHQWQSPT